MKAIDPQHFAGISGGEVGATGMGDDYHYTGVSDQDQAVGVSVAECVGGANGHSGASAWHCVWVAWDYISH